MLAEKISESSYLQKAEIYIDGFYSFTPQEYLIIQQLMHTCEKVTITNTLDPFSSQNDDLSLFRMTTESFQTIQAMAKQLGVEVEVVKLAKFKKVAIHR